MNTLASRKKLLIAESDLNRAQLIQDGRMLTEEINALVSQGKTLGGVVASAITLGSGLASHWRKKSASTVKKTSMVQGIWKGVQLAGWFWSALRGPKK